MSLPAIVWALSSLAIAAGTWAVYLAKVKQHRTPARPVASIVLQLLALASGLATILLGNQLGPGSAVLAGTGMMMAAVFLFLLTQRKTPLGAIQVKVGDKLPAFSAVASDGIAFTSADLSGQRILLKFFRGSW